MSTPCLSASRRWKRDGLRIARLRGREALTRTSRTSGRNVLRGCHGNVGCRLTHPGPSPGWQVLTALLYLGRSGTCGYSPPAGSRPGVPRNRVIQVRILAALFGRRSSMVEPPVFLGECVAP
jgi:hypothetical protein